MIKYNQTSPPIYDLKNIKTPVALYWGILIFCMKFLSDFDLMKKTLRYEASKDWLSDPNDISYLRENLPNIVDDYEVDLWNHVDFIWAINARELLYERIVKLMEKF